MNMRIHHLINGRPVTGNAYFETINPATQDELAQLDGIGSVLAGRIIEYRRLHGPFRSIRDLDKVKGIGPKTIEKNRGVIVVE